MYSKIDNRYIDDNQLLVEIIGRICSKTCRNYAERWRQSTDLVPARWLNRYPPDLVIKKIKYPVLGIIPGGDQSRHVEYPSVIKIDDKYFMYYCAYGEDNRWRLCMATSTDCVNWTRHGWIFSDGELPEGFRGNVAFPNVIKDAATGGYLMYFSTASEFGQPYDRICWAYSEDGWKWQFGGVAIDENGLKPLALAKPGGQYIMFFIDPESESTELKVSYSQNGRDWGKANVLVNFPSNLRGMYTVSGMFFNNKLLIFLESNTSIGRHDTLLFAGNDENDLKPVKNNPVIVDRDWEKKWDTIRYGFNILQDGQRYLLFYNGLPYLGAEVGGQIGLAELDINLLQKYVKESE